MRLRLATYNIESFGGDSQPIPLAARVANLRPKLEALDADVLCLQEVNAERRSKHGPRELGALDALLSGTRYATYERVTTHRDGGGPFDVHNLVVVSRFPVEASAQHLHDGVRPIESEIVRGMAPAERLAIGWDRPALEAALSLPDGRTLHVFDVHLRAPIAAAIAGQKLSGSSWRSTQGWAEGFFAAAVKRAGQALEVRLRIDRLFDDDPCALVILAGDLNADPSESAPRILSADEADTGSASLASRRLLPLLDVVPEARRFTSRYRGRACQPDHVLGSPRIAEGLVSATIANDDVEDGWDVGLASRPVEGSLHAPAVVEIDLGATTP
jgi:endonuclease/exonuclease/phosphatase family metal-dependent hydrolase